MWTNSLRLSVLTLIFSVSLAFTRSSVTFENGDPARTKFYLYNDKTNFSLWAGRKLKLNDPSSLKGLSPNIPTKFLIHGFIRNHTCRFPQQVKDAYMTQSSQPINIVTVDWSSVSQPPGYFRLTYLPTVAKLDRVSHDLSTFILALKKLNLINLDTTHLIGYSLGAHISGLAGQMITERYPEKISRITGLDPAGPGFDIRIPLVHPKSRRIQKSDARFVDIIHSDVGTGFRNFLGLEYGTQFNLGHADFYLNGGRAPQPGCENVEDVTDCSHYGSVNLFMQSIGWRKVFRGCRCNYTIYTEGGCDYCQFYDSAVVGENADPRTRGEFYLKTDLVSWNEEYKC